MANKFPYVASPGPLAKAIEHLRKKAFPRELTAETLRKLGVAPKNESYVINVLRFLGFIDEEGKKVESKANAFVQHKDEEFTSQFGAVVREAYGELFELNGENAWEMDRASLVQFFRSSDHSTDIVGSRQAGTFQYLASLSGHGVAPIVRETATRKVIGKKAAPSEKKNNVKEEKANNPATSGSKAKVVTPTDDHSRSASFGLTVRIEVNLPADGNQETYDNIFRSIRKNLIDGQSD